MDRALETAYRNLPMIIEKVRVRKRLCFVFPPQHAPRLCLRVVVPCVLYSSDFCLCITVPLFHFYYFLFISLLFFLSRLFASAISFLLYFKWGVGGGIGEFSFLLRFSLLAIVLLGRRLREKVSFVCVVWSSKNDSWIYLKSFFYL